MGRFACICIDYYVFFNWLEFFLSKTGNYEYIKVMLFL